MRRGLYCVLMVLMVLRGFAGTAMAAGVLPPLQPTGVAHVQDHPHRQAPTEAYAHTHEHGIHQATKPLEAQSPGGDHTIGQPDDDPTAHSLTASSCDGSPAGCAAHEHHSAACSACEICHSAMLDAPTALTPAPLPTGPQLPLTSAQFDSALAALAIKPPIA